MLDPSEKGAIVVVSPAERLAARLERSKPLIRERHKALTKAAEFARNSFTIGVIMIAGYSYAVKTGDIVIAFVSVLVLALLGIYCLYSFKVAVIWASETYIEPTRVEGKRWKAILMNLMLLAVSVVALLFFYRVMTAVTGIMDSLDLAAAESQQ